MIRQLVYSAYDQACEVNLKEFLDLFDNLLMSTFYNPWVFLKGATAAAGEDTEDLADEVLPSFDDTKERIPVEIESRCASEVVVSRWLQDIPSEASLIDEAVDKVQMLVLRTYDFIRSQVCDQVE